MFYLFPLNTFVTAIRDYVRPYDDPIEVKAGDIVCPVTDGGRKTDILGWTWCVAPDGRGGWTPDSWCEASDTGWRMIRDFSALELTIRTGDRLRLIYSESGFLFCETDAGDRGWVPDGAVAIDL